MSMWRSEIRNTDTPIFRDLFRGLWSSEIGGFSPLDLSPSLLLDAQRIARYSASLPIAKVRRETEGDEVDIYGYNPNNPRQYKTSAGGAYVTTESLLFPVETFYVVTWYDQSVNTNNAAQATAAQQPQFFWEGATFGSELDSGNLSIGTIYEITAQTDADFTLDGAPDSNVGTIFKATGTNVTLDAGDKVKEVLTWDYPIVKFDGINDVLVVTNHASINFGTSDYSIFLNLLPETSIPTALRIMDKRDANGIYNFYQNGNNLSAFVSDGVNTGTALLTSVVDGISWLNITSVADRSANIDIYNGTTKTSGSSLAAVGDIDSATPLYIGNLNTVTAQWYCGKIKTAQLYPSAVNSEQIEELNIYYA